MDAWLVDGWILLFVVACDSLVQFVEVCQVVVSKEMRRRHCIFWW